MVETDGDTDEVPPPPRENPELIGHGAAETALLDAWNAGRMAHAWMLCGPRGIGKATLAYRFARFVLAGGGGGGLFGDGPDGLAMDPDDPVSSRYRRSVALLAAAASWRAERGSEMRVKSSLMLGLGETNEEIVEVFRDLRKASVDVLTLGQYLQPTREHLRVERFVPPAEFDELAKTGRELGFLHVEAGPLVRSSYHAERHRGNPDPSPLLRVVRPD